MKKIIVVAGDKSGDLYGGYLCAILKEKFPGLEIYSFGGSNLAKASHQIIDLVSYSVCGLVEVISSLKKIFDIFRLTLLQINKLKPDLIILIDFPDFNLRLAKVLNRKFPIFYYVSPQVWAWRKNRVNLIKKYIDKMVVIFKFEKDFYQKEGVETFYFGHPLLDIIGGVNAETKNLITFLPGSRENELKKHLPLLRKTEELIKKELKNYRFLIMRPNNIEKSFYQKIWPDAEIVEHSYQTIAESKFIVSSAGTATVEIAILGIPHIIIYKVNPLSWQLLKRMVKLDYVGMVNILSSEKIVEELLQKDANPERIAVLTVEYLENQDKYLQLKNKLLRIKQLLEPRGSSEKFAEFIGDYLKLS